MKKMWICFTSTAQSFTLWWPFSLNSDTRGRWRNVLSPERFKSSFRR